MLVRKHLIQFNVSFENTAGYFDDGLSIYTIDCTGTAKIHKFTKYENTDAKINSKHKTDPS